MMHNILNSQNLSALRFFSVAAEKLSFSQTAEVLHVTPAAVSQQIRQLEERLGFKLFVRHNRQLSLTPEGQQLAATTHQAFQQIEERILSLHQQQLQGEVLVQTLPSLGIKWLVNHLGDFQQAYPDIQLRIEAEDSATHLRSEQFDIAIDLGIAPYDGFDCTYLCKEAIFPVCSPSYQKKMQIQGPDDLMKCQLLHDMTAWRGSSDYSEWQYWTDDQLLSQLTCQQGLVFNRALMAYQAAISGQGSPWDVRH